MFVTNMVVLDPNIEQLFGLLDCNGWHEHEDLRQVITWNEPTDSRIESASFSS